MNTVKIISLKFLCECTAISLLSKYSPVLTRDACGRHLHDYDFEIST